MKVGDYFVQGRRRWVRLHEKGGKEHDVPCHHSLDQFLDEYIAAAGIADDIDGYLFRTAGGKTGILTQKPLSQPDAYRMVQRRAKAAGIGTRIGNHTFRGAVLVLRDLNFPNTTPAGFQWNPDQLPCPNRGW
jgi:integrase